MVMPRKADPRHFNLTVRLSTAEYATLAMNAKAAGMTASNYTRQALFGTGVAAATDPATTQPVPAGLRDLAYQVRKVGVNLNQIARRMNEDRTPPPRDLTMLLAEIRDYVRRAWQFAP